MSRNWELFARDVEDACRKICRYTQGLDQAGFLRDELVYDATLRTQNALRLGPDALQALMRHKSYLTTKRYINMARQLDGAVQQLHVPELPEIVGK